MTRPCLPRWAVIALMPVLAGAVLLMHGVGAGAHQPPTAAQAGAEDRDHHSSGEPCNSCPSGHHLVIACVAVAVTIATVRRARLHPGSARPARVVPLRARGREWDSAIARPPDPAWVRLSVMRC